MIRAVRISRFRGIRECVADGFGPVNLLIGKNDCGKTAFMEAVQVAEEAENAIHHLLRDQGRRLGRAGKRRDFERFWQPIFFDLDAKRGLSISTIGYDGAAKRFDLRQGVVTEEIIAADSHDRSLQNGDEYETSSEKQSTWALDVEITTWAQGLVDSSAALSSGGSERKQRVLATAKGVRLPPMLNLGGDGSVWILSSPRLGELEVRNVSALKQRGEDRALVELLREVDSRVSGIELLAPSGDVAELFVRLDHGTPLLPATLMGDGFQRCLELGAAAAAHDWPTIFIDEIENGMHHLVLEPMWRWIASIARRRNLQVFATTHSEECIAAACRAFQSLDDDGLRVIRLDRLETETRATIYDRALVEAAERTGIEIRG